MYSRRYPQIHRFYGVWQGRRIFEFGKELVRKLSVVRGHRFVISPILIKLRS